MADEMVVAEGVAADEAGAARVYEAGYHIHPNVKEQDLDAIVGGVRAVIEKHGGSLIAEGAPALARFSYPMAVREGEKKIEYDRGYFGWLKFEASAEAAAELERMLAGSAQFIRAIVFRTVREDTRAKYKAPTLREVKRTDTIRATPRRAEEAAGPVSEEDLEKAIRDITAE